MQTVKGSLTLVVRGEVLCYIWGFGFKSTPLVLVQKGPHRLVISGEGLP